MRGFSVLELLLSAVLFCVLTTLATLAWVRGSRTWLYSSKLSARLNQMCLFRHRVERELLESNVLTVEAESTAMALASAYGMRGTPEAQRYFVQAGQPQWQKYCLYYLSQTTLYGREIAVPRSELKPLSQFDFGAGPRALPFYSTGGKALAESVSRFEANYLEGTLHFELECSEAYVGQNQRKLRLASTTLVRS